MLGGLWGDRWGPGGGLERILGNLCAVLADLAWILGDFGGILDLVGFWGGLGGS